MSNKPPTTAPVISARERKFLCTIEASSIGRAVMQDLLRLFLAYEMLPEMASSLCTIGFLRQATEAKVGDSRHFLQPRV
jgi:hypothetical protein